jgi:hypothetical protein
MALTTVRPQGMGFVTGRRNLIINGAMQVAQRGTSSTSVTSTGYHSCDRFKFVYTDAGTWTVSQSTDAPDGFANSFKVECTTAKGTLASDSRLLIIHHFEGQNLQQLKKGTSYAESLTLSFYVRTNKTGTYQVNLEDNDNIRIIGTTYTVSSVNTWQKVTATFVGDTSGVLDNDNGDSFAIHFPLVAGTDNSSGAVPTSWEAKSNTDRGAGLTVNLADATSNYWQITGVQLEVGTNASDFEHRSFGEELSLCQRYFFQVREGSGEFTQFAPGRFYSTSAGNALVRFPQPMRANPSLTALGATGDYDFSPTNLPQAGQVTTTANTAGSTADVIAMAVGNNFSSVTSGAMYILGGNAGTGGAAGLQFDAEL